MDALDRRLLDVIQTSVPLVSRPFAALGRELGASEQQVLSRTARLKDEGIIRQIGPIFSSRRLGYQSTLVALRVDPERLTEVAGLISAHPGVSHNYSRNHFYNLWFTLTLPREQNQEEAIADLAAAGSVDDYLNLPSVRRFKLGVHFDMSGDCERGADGGGKTKEVEVASVAQPEKEAGLLTDQERDVVRVLQGDLPLQQRPFRSKAAQISISEERLLETARDLDRSGVMRRFSAVLKHRRAGFTANGMGCWVVPEDRIVEAGRAAAAFPAVSHCYQRPAYPPRWPYNLFTMVHGRTREEVETIVARICDEIGPVEHTVLYSKKEYKKKRVLYFAEEER